MAGAILGITCKYDKKWGKRLCKARFPYLRLGFGSNSDGKFRSLLTADENRNHWWSRNYAFMRWRGPWGSCAEHLDMTAQFLLCAYM